jgi:hypothetical protein
MATTNIQSFSGDVEVTGELTVTGQLNSTTGSDKVKLTATTADETDYIPLSKGTTGAQALYTDSNLTYNPSNNVIGANISGNASFATNATYATSAGYATNAGAVAFTDRDTNNETDYIAFVSGHDAGNKAFYTDSNLTYNPSTNHINANVTYAQSAGSATNATFANAATNATYANSSGYYNFYNNGTGYVKWREGNANYALINWGKSGNIGIGSSAYMTFRTAFANIYSVVSTRIESSGGQSFAWSSGQIANSGFRIYSNGARVGSWYYIAVGRG